MRKRGNRYRRNPYNVPIRPIPESFEDDAKEYLTNLQSLSTTGFNIKNEKGQNIPVRYKEGMLQSYEKGAWRDIVGKEVKETTTETVRETVTRASGSSSSELPVASISRIIQSYLDRHILDNGKLKLDLQPFTFGNYLTFDSSTGDLTSRDTTYSAGANITIDQNNVISATGGNTYTVASPLEMNNNCISLPTVTSADEGKILKVVNGAWALAEGSGGGGGTTGWLPTELELHTGTSGWTITDNVATRPSNIGTLIVTNGNTTTNMSYGVEILFTVDLLNPQFYFLHSYTYSDTVTCHFTNGQSSSYDTCEAKIIATTLNNNIVVTVHHRWYSND